MDVFYRFGFLIISSLALHLCVRWANSYPDKALDKQRYILELKGGKIEFLYSVKAQFNSVEIKVFREEMELTLHRQLEICRC